MDVRGITNARRPALVVGYVILQIIAFIALALAGGVKFALPFVGVLLLMEVILFGSLHDENAWAFLFVDAVYHAAATLALVPKFGLLQAGICVTLFAGLKLTLFLGLHPEWSVRPQNVSWPARSASMPVDTQERKITWEENVTQPTRFVDIPEERSFVEEERFGTCDPVDGTPFARGETVVVCECQTGYHESSWRFVEDNMGGKCLNCHETAVTTRRVRL